MQGHNPVNSPHATPPDSDADKVSKLAELQRHVTQRDVFPSMAHLNHGYARMQRIVQDGDAHRFVQSFSGLVDEVARTRVGKGRPFALMVETGLVDLRAVPLIKPDGQDVLDDELVEPAYSHLLVTRSDSDINRLCTSLVEKLDQRWCNPPKSGFFGRSQRLMPTVAGIEARMMTNCPLRCDLFLLPGPNYLAGAHSDTPWQYILMAVIDSRFLRAARSIVVNCLAKASSMGDALRRGSDDPAMEHMWRIDGVVAADDPDLPAVRLCDHALAQLSTYSIEILDSHTNMVPRRLAYHHDVSECADDQLHLEVALKKRAV